jgi:hypothetical protein
MPLRLHRFALLAALAIPGIAAGADAVDPGKPSQEYLDERAKLEAMISSRDVEEFEVSFKPLALDRVLLKDRLGGERLYHYLTFRLRNEITEDTKQLAQTATRYNEVLQEMANEHEYAKVEQGVTLKVDGETVLDRSNMRARKRTVQITALAYDENGSRIEILDDTESGKAARAFPLPDYGDAVAGSSLDRVKEKVEEAVGRRLRTADEIRTLELPPYDAQKLDEEGVAEGEVYGVLLFDRLGDHGDRFTIEIRGLSNKLRIKASEAEPGAVGNYANTKVMRRVYVLHYQRPGDEFFRDQDRFLLERGGWEWTETFQRLGKRAAAAYAQYYLDNISDAAGARQAAVEEKFWPSYEKDREAAADKLPDLQGELKQRGNDGTP